MPTNKTFLIALGLWVSFAFHAGAGTELNQDFAHLDRAYIPVLAMTSAQKAAPAARAMAVLDRTWNQFDADWRGAGNDPQWANDFAAVERHIDVARGIIAQKKELLQAHEALEHVRVIFMRLRERNGIDYFVDRLTRFHEDMEAIVLLAKGKTPATLTAEDRMQIRVHLKPAKAEWAGVLAVPVNRDRFGFSEAQTASLVKVLLEEQTALMTLEAQLAGDDAQRLIKAAVGIKSPFAKTFKLFGDFKGLGPS